MDQNLGTARQQLVKALRGRSLIVPDLHSLLDHWPQSVNLEEKRLRDDVDRKLERCVILNVLLFSAKNSQLIYNPAACSQKAKGCTV